MRLVVRPERPSDFASIKAIVTGSFGDDSRMVALLVDRIRGSDEYEPELALVAEEESAIVGHLMLSWVGLAGAARKWVLNLTPLSVRSDRQRCGTRLISAAHDLAEERGEPLVMVEGVPAYYPRFGFERARPLGFEPPHPNVPDAAFMVKRLRAYDPRSAAGSSTRQRSTSSALRTGAGGAGFCRRSGFECRRVSLHAATGAQKWRWRLMTRQLPRPGRANRPFP